MEQEEITRQIFGLLENAGFHRSEITHQVITEFASGPDSISVRCTRDYEGMVLLLNAEVQNGQTSAADGYQLVRLRVSQQGGSNELELRAEEGDYLHTSYAMYLFAGKFNTLLLQIYELEFAAVSGHYGIDIVQQRLKNLPDDCRVQGHFSDHSGMADYSMHIVKASYGYFVKDYTMKFTAYPQLRHGTFAGVDTGVLEQDMAAVNWSNEQEIYVAGQTEPFFHPPIQGILDRLAVLSTDIAGGYTGDILQLKYMQASDLSEVLIHDHAWETFAQLPQKEAIFPPGIPLRGAANLMAGRHRLITDGGQILPEAYTWQKMSGVTADSNVILSRMEAYPWTELRNHVRRVTAHDDEVVRITARLAEGNLVLIRPQSGGKAMFVRADPVNRQLDLLTPDMRAIPFNFHFDPDWKPAPDPRQHLNKEHHRNQTKSRRDHRKGNGLK